MNLEYHELVSYLSEAPLAGVFFIDAPSGAGKTRLIKRLISDAHTSFCFTSELLCTFLVHSVRANKSLIMCDSISDDIKRIAIEDLDYTLSGKDFSQLEIARWIRLRSMSAQIYITGISLFDRLPYLFSALDCYTYIRKDGDLWNITNLI